MRIAHVVSTYPPYRGGQGNVAREIAERTRASRHEVAIITPRRDEVKSKKFKVKNIGADQLLTSYFLLLTSPWARFGNAAWCPSIRSTLEELQPDVVHLHWPFIGGIAPVLAWRRRGPSRTQSVVMPSGDLSQFRAKLRKKMRPRWLVVQYHMDLIGSGWRCAAFSAYQRRTLPRVLAVADRVVVSSFDYAQHGTLAPFVEQLGERLREIPLGVDIERFASMHAAEGFSPPQLNCGGLKSAATALFVGGLDRAHAFKGVPVLLEAMVKRSQGPYARVPGTFSLRIVGDGDLRASYEAQARALGIADRVEFLGAVSDTKLPEIYRNADVLVLPSTSRSEAFGIVLLEAMASGLPVIASNLPGVRTVVADGETGFLVPPGDVAALMERLRALASDPMLRQRMGDAARARVLDQYTWEYVHGRWVELYNACVSS